MPEYRIGTKILPQPNIGPSSTNERRGYTSRPRTQFDWSAIPASDIGELVHRATAAGCALILGRTSDGGALSITVLDGERKDRLWPHSYDEIADIIGSFPELPKADGLFEGDAPLHEAVLDGPEKLHKRR